MRDKATMRLNHPSSSAKLCSRSFFVISAESGLKAKHFVQQKHTEHSISLLLSAGNCVSGDRGQLPYKTNLLQIMCSTGIQPFGRLLCRCVRLNSAINCGARREGGARGADGRSKGRQMSHPNGRKFLGPFHFRRGSCEAHPKLQKNSAAGTCLHAAGP